METSRGMQEYNEAEKIDAALRQGYEICHAHYPPVVMTSKDDQNWMCPECDNTKFTGVSVSSTMSV